MVADEDGVVQQAVRGWSCWAVCSRLFEAVRGIVHHRFTPQESVRGDFARLGQNLLVRSFGRWFVVLESGRYMYLTVPDSDSAVHQI